MSVNIALGKDKPEGNGGLAVPTTGRRHGKTQSAFVRPPPLLLHSPYHSYSPPSTLPSLDLHQSNITIMWDQAFDNTSTSVAASQMRNALNRLADTVENEEEKKVRCYP